MWNLQICLYKLLHYHLYVFARVNKIYFAQKHVVSLTAVINHIVDYWCDVLPVVFIINSLEKINLDKKNLKIQAKSCNFEPWLPLA